MNRQRLTSVYRVGFGLLTTAALVSQYLNARAHPPFNPVNFFSFMTTLSNLFGAIIFFRTGLSTRRTRSIELLRGAAGLYLTVGFVVYVLLLSDIPMGILRPWVNVVLHYVMPLAVFCDWVCAPPEHRLELRQTLSWLAVPLAFVVYSLIRGAAIDWYPYPFLDPGKVGGYGGVAMYCVAIMFVFVLFAILLTWLGDFLRERTTRGA